MCVRSNPGTDHPQGYRIVFKPGVGQAGLACWLALPDSPADDAPPLVAVHGIRRGAELQAELFGALAAERGQAVIAPVFDKVNWLGYQQAFLCGRADLALLDLLLALRRAGIVQAERMELFGFSGGAQFAHRFAMLHPDRVSRLSIASPGWYTFPDEASYPYGLWPRPRHADEWTYSLVANLDRFLAIPMQVCVGEHDRMRDKNTRSGVAIDAQQGRHRLARAHRWTEAIRRSAMALRIEPDVALQVLPNCGHDFETCMVTGGLGRIVIPEAPSTVCGDLCSPQARQACLERRGLTTPGFMEASG